MNFNYCRQIWTYVCARAIFNMRLFKENHSQSYIMYFLLDVQGVTHIMTEIWHTCYKWIWKTKGMFGHKWGICRSQNFIGRGIPSRGFLWLRISHWYWCPSIHIIEKNWSRCANLQKRGFANPMGGGRTWKSSQMRILISPNPFGFTIANRGFLRAWWKSKIFSLRIWLPNMI